MIHPALTALSSRASGHADGNLRPVMRAMLLDERTDQVVFSGRELLLDLHVGRGMFHCHHQSECNVITSPTSIESKIYIQKGCAISDMDLIDFTVKQKIYERK
jgi:hypothetical protein